MNMNFFVLSRLLSSTTTLLASGYVAFALSIISIQLKAWQSLTFWILICLVFILCAIHHYISIRVKFDADILSTLAQQSKQQNENGLTQALDHSLLYFKLMPQNKAGRDWDLRFQGCLKLFKIQMTFVVMQYIVLITLIFKLLAQ